MVPRIGTELAGYRIEALLGRGGMSVVYRAENPRLGMTIALKVLAPELSDDESFRERFVSESRLAASLNHPNIITIYDAGEADGSLYIAMRYVAGDLRAILRREGLLAPARALALLGQVADALDAAHAEGLIHRDVKPANILIDGGGRSGRPELAYLADFGLTKHAGSRSGPTATGQFLGTIDYMAPEQIESRDVDARTDGYSLGCVLFESITGSPPFQRDSEAAVLWAHMHEPPPRASEHRAGIPAGVDAAITRALAKGKDERFQSCSELIAAVRTAAERAATVPVGKPPAPDVEKGDTVERAAPPEARPRKRAPLALLLATAALAGGGIAAAGFLTAGDSEAVTTVLTRTRTVAPPPEEFSAFDKEVLSLVPASFRETCDHVDPVTPDFDSTVSCKPGDGVLRARYSHARSGPLLQEYFRQRVTRAGITVDPSRRLYAIGTCGETSRAVREWIARGRAGHEEASDEVLAQQRASPRGLRDLRGHVLCYESGGRAWIEWTDARAGIYGLAFGSSTDGLVEWWRTESGPVG